MDDTFVARNIPERIVLVVDTRCNGSPTHVLMLSQIKAALRVFVHLKSRTACADHKLELWAVSDVVFQVTSGDMAHVFHEISSLAPHTSATPIGDVDMSELTAQLAAACGTQSPDAPLSANPLSTLRMIYISAQSRTEFQRARSASHFDLLAENQLFYLDAVMLVPDKDCRPGTPPSKLEACLRSLPFDAAGRSQIHVVASSDNGDRLFERIAALVAHPLQRSSTKTYL